MVGHPLRGLKRTLRKSRGALHARRRRGKQPWFVESLEDRLLLAGSPTIYTVNSTDNGTTGTGDSGTLPYIIGQANANTNTAGSEIQFDSTVFKTAQTITLASTLTLSETAGPEVIDGPGAGIVTVSGNNAIEVCSVASGVTAFLSGLSISDGNARPDTGISAGGILNNGNLTVTNSSIEYSSAFGSGGVIWNQGMLTLIG
jgi:hypothetical protein